MRFLATFIVLFSPCLLLAQVDQFVKVNPEVVNIGSIPCSFGTITSRVQLTNTDTEAVTFTGLSISGKDSSLFSVSIALPFRLSAGASRTLTVRFFPSCSELGERSAKLTLASARGTLFIPLEAQLIDPSEIVVDEITIPDLRINVGDTFDLPIIVTDFTPATEIASWALQMSFNASVITPLDPEQRGIIASGKHTINMVGNLQTSSNVDTLAVIRMVALLGDAESTEVNLTQFSWHHGDQFNTRVYTRVPQLLDGSVSIADIYHDPRNNTPRLVNAEKGTLALSVVPNPVTAASLITIGYDAHQHPVTLIIYSALGEVILNLNSELPGSLGTNQRRVQAEIPISPDDLPGPGVYFVRLVSSEMSLSRLLFVE